MRALLEEALLILQEARGSLRGWYLAPRKYEALKRCLRRALEEL